MKHFGFTYTGGQVFLRIEESPWWTHALVAVADAVCAVSGHRLCQSLIVWAYGVEGRHITHELSIPVDRARWVEWAALTGAEDPSWQWEDDEVRDA